MCTALVGCNRNEDASVNHANQSLNESNIESHIESIFGSDKGSSSESEPFSEPEEIKYAATDEILNADFSSGLIQMNNDVFQQGGYITVSELVEKYNESYDISYFAPQNQILTEMGSYDECREYLLEYGIPSIGTMNDNMEINCNYRLVLTPKFGNNPLYRKIKVYIGNVTSPNEKITLDKATVLCFTISPRNDIAADMRSNIPIWAAYGIGVNGNRLNTALNKYWRTYDGIETTFESCTPKDITDFLDNLGCEVFVINNINSKDWYTMGDVYIALDKCGLAYGEGNNTVYVYATGDVNLFDTRPLYKYTFCFDSNTDKLS
ncbi:MAG: hypothetical protein K2J80_07635, partial [Oscillospiraceae bacterium]|nr:hypothetical protein [Oscillospiraceae bacterium]